MDCFIGLQAARIAGPNTAIGLGRSVGRLGPRQLQLAFQETAIVTGDALGVGARDRLLRKQPLEVKLVRGRMTADRLIELRLGKRRLVAFVVAVTPVADHVDDCVALEAAAVIERERSRLHHSFGIVPVDVKNRNLQHLRDIAGVTARPCFRRTGGKADLIIDDHMERAADPVGEQVA